MTALFFPDSHLILIPKMMVVADVLQPSHSNNTFIPLLRTPELQVLYPDCVYVIILNTKVRTW